jgi:hypothetical protein
LIDITLHPLLFSLDTVVGTFSFSSSIEEEGVNLADEDRLGECVPSYEDQEEDEQEDVEDEDDNVYDARKSSRTALSPIQEGPGLEA